MNQERKRGIIFIILAILIFSGMIYFSYTGKRNETYGKIQGSVLQTKPPEASGNMEQNPSAAPEEQTSPAAQTEEPELETEVPELEEMSAELDISSIPDEVIEILGISRENLQKQIKIFANGQGFASERSVCYYGEYTIDSSIGTVSVPLYFDPEDSGMEVFSFNLIYYQESKDFIMEPW